MPPGVGAALITPPRSLASARRTSTPATEPAQIIRFGRYADDQANDWIADHIGGYRVSYKRRAVTVGNEIPLLDLARQVQGRQRSYVRLAFADA